MAIIAGKQTVVTLGGNDISAFVDSIDLPWDYDEYETTTFGASAAKTFMPGNYEMVISFSGKVDTTATTGGDARLRAALGAAATAMTVKPGNSTFTWTVSGFLKSYHPSVPVNDVCSYSAEYRVSGAVSVA